MTKFAIVRAEPTEEMRKAGQGPWATNDRQEAARSTYRAMLAASEPLTDAEVEKLAIAYEIAISGSDDDLPDHYLCDRDGAWTYYAPIHVRRRARAIEVMRRFITKVSA